MLFCSSFWNFIIDTPIHKVTFTGTYVRQVWKIYNIQNVYCKHAALNRRFSLKRKILAYAMNCRWTYRVRYKYDNRRHKALIPESRLIKALLIFSGNTSVLCSRHTQYFTATSVTTVQVKRSFHIIDLRPLKLKHDSCDDRYSPGGRLSAFPTFGHHRRLVEKAQRDHGWFQATSLAVHLHRHRYAGSDPSGFALAQRRPCSSGL